jgi:hypothetical protein
VSHREVTWHRDRGPRGPRIVWGRARALGSCIGCGLLCLLLSVAGPTRALAAGDAAADSLHKLVVVWPDVTMLVEDGQVRDVAFAASGLNIVNAGEMAWCADVKSHSLIAVATKPIAGTAAAGEEMGRAGAEAIEDPAALYVGASEQFILETEPQLVILHAGTAETTALDPVSGPERDVVVGATGLIYVLLGNEIRVLTNPPGPAPLWTVPVPRRLAPAVAIAVSARGELVVAGRGAIALAKYELDASGTFHQIASRSAQELGVEQPSGVAITPALLIELAGREGWVARDRFVLVGDAKRAGIVALETSTLEPVGRVDLAGELPGLVPGRFDVSNRAQIAMVDDASGRALALPARLFADLVDKATIRWKTLSHDSTTTGEAGP